MKKKLYITALALTTIVLLALPFIPHHHHESAVCTVVEHCSSDNADNDKHTSHKDDGTKCFEQGSWDVASVKTLHTNNIHYEKFSGRKALDSDITFELNNQSDNVVYLDLGNCFFKNGRNTENYYKNTATQTSKDKNVGVSVNAGTITDVLGVGGLVGNIANGINVGGSKGNTTGVTVFSQRIIALALILLTNSKI